MRKLIKTKDYLLYVDNEEPIFQDDLIIMNEEEGVVTANDEWNGESGYEWMKVIAHYCLNSESKKLNIPFLPQPPFKNAVEKIALKELGYNNNEDILDEEMLYHVNCFVKGYMFALHNQPIIPYDFIPDYSVIGECSCICHRSISTVMHMIPCCYPKTIDLIIIQSDGTKMLSGIYKF